MATKNKTGEEYKYELTKSEQKTTATYKILAAENESLKTKLEDAQNELEKTKKIQFEKDKENSILKYRLNSISFIEFLKFGSTAFIGVAGAYLVASEYKTALFIGVPAIIIFGVIIIFSNKK